MAEPKIVAAWEMSAFAWHYRVGKGRWRIWPEHTGAGTRFDPLQTDEGVVSRIEVEREVHFGEHPNEHGLATWVTTETLSQPRVLIYVNGSDHPRWSLPLGAVGLEYGEAPADE